MEPVRLSVHPRDFSRKEVFYLKPYAIKENHLYRKAFQRGKRWSGKFVTVCVLKDHAAKRLKNANPQKQYINRIGLSVPKREGGAIERNRVKRIIRAGFAGVERRTPLRRGYLIVIAARPGIERQKSPAIESELRYIFKKLEMIEPRQAPAGAAVVPSPDRSPDKNTP